MTLEFWFDFENQKGQTEPKYTNINEEIVSAISLAILLQGEVSAMKPQYLVYLAFAIALQGCASLSKNLVQNVPQTFELSPTGSDGLIVLSTRFTSVGCPSESRISSAFLTVAKDGSRLASDTVWMKSRMLEPDPVDPTRQLFVRRLKAGQYNLGQLNYAFSSLEKASTNEKIAMPFNVMAGQAYYLGEVVVTAENCRTLNVRVNNQRKRDMDWLKTRLTNVSPAAIKDQILSVNEGS